jgi:hypothetical protein
LTVARTRRFRVAIIVTVVGAASVAGACRSGMVIRDSRDVTMRSAPQASAPLPQSGTVAASLVPGEGMDVVRSRCTACHEPAMLLQQRLTEQQWVAEITKMQGWGAVVADEEKGPMARYLVMIAGRDNTRFTPAMVAPVAADQATGKTTDSPVN